MNLSRVFVLAWVGISGLSHANEGDVRSVVDHDSGFTSIFNGQNLQGWTGATDDYTVQDAAIVCKPGRGGVLFTEKQYQDFIVRLEFKLPPGGNNGLAIRYPGTGRASYDGMCELQVLDNKADKYKNLDPRQYHGSVYGIAAARRGYLKPAGEWNFQEVSVQGSRIRVELNGTVILDADVEQISEYKDDRPHPGKSLTRGHFGFAGHSDPVMFRNIAIKELPIPQNQTTVPKPVFHASFDSSVDADLSPVDTRLYTSKSLKREDVSLGLDTDAVSLESKGGLRGGGLRFNKKSSEVIYYTGNQVGYTSSNWSGSISVWLKLDPDRDLEPGFCDPLQITARAWNDAALFIDFDKDLPRDFRLGVFSDYSYWNPDDIAWDDIEVDDRPMVTVDQPPFSAERWTHVCFTWKDINADAEQAAEAKLYLNGRLQGSLQQPMKFDWDPEKSAMMLGINYIGWMDELQVYPDSLSDNEVQQLYRSYR